MKTLKKPPHELSDSEFQSLLEVLRNKKERFTKASARTETISGQRVLIVQGSFDKNSPTQNDNKSIYIDSDGTGTAVQEIYFQAPLAVYKEHIKEVDSIINQLAWN